MKTKANGEKRLIKAPFYPLPTYRALVYAAVLFGFLTFAALRRNVPMRVAAAMLLVLPIISVLYGFICFCGISASFGFDKPFVRKGERARAVLTVYNYFPLPLSGLSARLYLPKVEKDGWVYTRLPFKQRLGVTMGGMRAVTASREAAFALSGAFPARCKTLSVYDPLGLFRFVSTICFEADMAVIPVDGAKVEEVKINTATGEGADRNRRGDDRDEVFEIADYVPGDSLKDIHWKKSAREEELQIIRYASPKEKCYCVLCDTGDYLPEKGGKKPVPVNAPILDAVLETAYGLCLSLASEGNGLLLAWRNGKEDVGVTATLDESFISLCKGGYIPLGAGKRVDPSLVAEADALTLVTGAINGDTAAQIIALQTEATNLKGISVTVCTPAGSDAAVDTNVVKHLESAGVTVTYSVTGKGGAK